MILWRRTVSTLCFKASLDLWRVFYQCSPNGYLSELRVSVVVHTPSTHLQTNPLWCWGVNFFLVDSSRYSAKTFSIYNETGEDFERLGSNPTISSKPSGDQGCASSPPSVISVTHKFYFISAPVAPPPTEFA